MVTSSNLKPHNTIDLWVWARSSTSMRIRRRILIQAISMHSILILLLILIILIRSNNWRLLIILFQVEAKNILRHIQYLIRTEWEWEVHMIEVAVTTWVPVNNSLINPYFSTKKFWTKRFKVTHKPPSIFQWRIQKQIWPLTWKTSIFHLSTKQDILSISHFKWLKNISGVFQIKEN